MTTEEQSRWITRGVTGAISLMLMMTAYLLAHIFEDSEERAESLAARQVEIATQVGENAAQIALNKSNLAWLRSITVAGEGPTEPRNANEYTRNEDDDDEENGG